MKHYSKAIQSVQLKKNRTQDLHFRHRFTISMNYAVLGRLPKRLSPWSRTQTFSALSSNPYNFRHYDLTHFAMYITGKQVPLKV